MKIFNSILGEATIPIWNLQWNNNHVFQTTVREKKNEFKENFSEASQDIFFVFPDFS